MTSLLHNHWSFLSTEWIQHVLGRCHLRDVLLKENIHEWPPIKSAQGGWVVLVNIQIVSTGLKINYLSLLSENNTDTYQELC